MNLSVVYTCTALVSLILMACYCGFARKRDPWFLLMFSAVLVVNVGYFALSSSHDLAEALLANRIAYFGSVFLPMSMLMIVLDATNLTPPKWVPVSLLALGVMVFLIAASPGYSTVYYQEVSLMVVNGATVLDKTYGPWHAVYLFYLVGYFAVMIAVIVYATLKKKVASNTYAVILATAVLVNIAVWFLEQKITIDFEFLSISYLISEVFLLEFLVLTSRAGLSQATRKAMKSDALHSANELRDVSIDMSEKAYKSAFVDVCACGDVKHSDLSCGSADSQSVQVLLDGLQRLTKTERVIFDLYLKNYGTKEIMAELDIKENTLKYHNKNMYAKLGVSSRKQLLSIAKAAL